MKDNLIVLLFQLLRAAHTSTYICFYFHSKYFIMYLLLLHTLSKKEQDIGKREGLLKITLPEFKLSMIKVMINRDNIIFKTLPVGF